MSQSFSIILGAIIFSAFVIGLAESINAIPFYVIVFLVVGMLVYESYEEVRSHVGLALQKLKQAKK